VISNGTAVLGLGAIGALASKPVMEGKAVLFKKFADIDVFDIEVDERDPQQFIEVVAALWSRPSAASILRTSRRRSASSSRRRSRSAWTSRCSMTTSTAPRSSFGGRAQRAGAGRQGYQPRSSWSPPVPAQRPWPALDLLVRLGLPRENIWITDLAGCVYQGRER
jgi:malate dehydrogenase (oxaloacetate-decarboxylating)(NADP+)